jgi:bifunctional pyridoxal-dependent enzyme with beta-cystathionase and maltose regulon repressor activities
VAILRKAFRETVSDPAFVAEAQRIGIEVAPIFGEQLQSIVRAMLATPRAIIDKLDDARNLKSAGARP